MGEDSENEVEEFGRGVADAEAKTKCKEETEGMLVGGCDANKHQMEKKIPEIAAGDGGGEDWNTPRGWRFKNQVGLDRFNVLGSTMGSGPAFTLGAPLPGFPILLLNFGLSSLGCCLLPGASRATLVVGGALAVVRATVVLGGSFLLFGGAVAGPVAFLPAIQAFVVALVTPG